MDFTKKFCTNEFPEPVRYLIIPNAWTVEKNDEHLNKKEITILNLWRRYRGVELSVEEAVDLLFHENEVPLWANISVVQVTDEYTVIEIFCSRRLRPKPKELFHIQVSMPPDYLEGVRFDANWKQNSRR